MRSETTELKPLFTKFQDDQTCHTGGIFTTVGFRHHIFGNKPVFTDNIGSRDFDSINVKLSTATIYYYGIYTKTYEPKVTMLSYSQADDCFYIDNGIQDGHIKAFEKELIKESLYLKHIAQ